MPPENQKKLDTRHKTLKEPNQTSSVVARDMEETRHDHRDMFRSKDATPIMRRLDLDRLSASHRWK